MDYSFIYKRAVFLILTWRTYLNID